MSVSRNTAQVRGVIVPLSAIMLTVMLALVGVGYYILGYGASAEMSRNSAKFTVLAALEAYMGEACDENESTANCHSAKMDAALTRANEIASRNSGGLSTVTLSQPGGQSSQFGSVLTPLRWFDKKPELSNPCPDGYPCGQPVGASELANAMKLSGKAMDRLSAMLTMGMLAHSADNSVEFSTTAVASPMHAMFIMDLSSSVAEETHLGPEEVELRNANAAWKSDDRESPYWASFFSYLAKSSVKNPSVVGDFVPDSENSAAVDDIWQLTPPTRGTATKVATDHYRDDYRLVFSYAETAEGRQAYQFASKHPEVGQDTIVGIDHGPREPVESGVDGTIPSEVLPILLDKYRDAIYQGPQPLTSIAKGIKRFLEKMSNRQVVGDKAGIVFASDRLTWNRVANLTTDLAYLNSILDFEHGASDSSPNKPNMPFDPSTVSSEPAWIQLNLFPWANKNTDLYGALRMASTQLATDGDLSLVGSDTSRPVLPSVDFVVIFTDGLGNCSPDGSGMTACINSYMTGVGGAGGYSGSKASIDTLAFEYFFKKKVPIHVVLAGKQSGPHMWKRALQADGGGYSAKCMTEAEVRDDAGRRDGLYSVDDVSCTSESECQAKWNDRFLSPFTLAVKDWYDIAVRTGGVYAPLLAVDASCARVDPNVACAAGQDTRFTHDPDCKDVDAQVDSYLGQILRGSNAFTIVDTD